MLREKDSELAKLKEDHEQQIFEEKEKLKQVQDHQEAIDKLTEEDLQTADTLISNMKEEKDEMAAKHRELENKNKGLEEALESSKN